MPNCYQSWLVLGPPNLGVAFNRKCKQVELEQAAELQRHIFTGVAISPIKAIWQYEHNITSSLTLDSAYGPTPFQKTFFCESSFWKETLNGKNHRALKSSFSRTAHKNLSLNLPGP